MIWEGLDIHGKKGRKAGRVEEKIPGSLACLI